MRYQSELLKHRTSGDVYAVRVTDGVISEAAGPLHYREFQTAVYDGFDGCMDTAEWIRENRDQFEVYTRVIWD